MFILDVLRYDIEQLPSILKLLNDTGCIGWRHQWPRDFTANDITPALRSLVEQGLVELLEYSAKADALVRSDRFGRDFESRNANYWYRITDSGREEWKQWTPVDT